MRFPLCVGSMLGGTMFSSVCVLPSPTSAEGCPPCSAGSSVLRRSPTAPERSCPPFGLWPSRTGLAVGAKTSKSPLGSRACCFSACAGSNDYAGPINPLAFNVVVVLPSSHLHRVGTLFQRVFEAQSPRPLIPLSTLRPTPRDAARKTRGQDGFAALLSCRALSSPTTCRFIPTLEVLPVIQDRS